MAKHDDRIIIYNVGKNISETLKKVGYPFKSKEHSYKLALFQKNGVTQTVEKYLNSKNKFSCPDKLKYQFTHDFNIRISDRCCYEFKKKPAKEWAIKNNKTIKITGMRREEGGYRNNLNCIILKDDKLNSFHPLSVINENFENWFINYKNIKLCELYYPPFNFKRTGCKGCPFALHLQDELDSIRFILPNEKKQCEIIWKPVYEEYRRIGYRLNHQNYPLFDD